ncbi:hypothetical protein ACOMHN_037045 [Nucella lapillus]
MFFFTSQDTSLNSHIGTLHLGGDSSFHYVTGDPKEGFRFDLNIQRKKTKFRVKKQYDREMWRGYIEAVITGRVPQDVTLSPQDLHIIESKCPSPSPSPSISASERRPSAPLLSADLNGSASSSSSLWHTGRERCPSLPSLVSTSTGSSGGDGGFDPPGLRNVVNFTIHDPSQHSFDSGVSDNTGGPFMMHKFDTEENASPPSWFFEDCNRSVAEKVLTTECRRYGNTLMRVSNSARPFGSYVISKRLESSDKIVHYEVMRVAEGYKINAENTSSAMKTLGEVMKFFIQLSGPSTTHPMQCNDLRKLGIQLDDYDRGPIGPHLDQPLPRVASQNFVKQENYEVPNQQGTPPPHPPPCPVPAPPSLPPSLAKAPYKTWGKETAVGARWDGQPGSGPAAKTVGPADRWQQRPDSAKPSAMQMSQSLQEMNAVANLEAVLTREEQRGRARGAADNKRPLPPVPSDAPPKPCGPGSSIGYVNADSAPPADEESVDGVEGSGGSSHSRWNLRSQSVPNLPQGMLNVNVPSRMKPPPIIKAPPPTATKTGPSRGDPTVFVPPKAARILGTRHTSLPLYQLKGLHQRWSSKRHAVPLPLPPDYSSQRSSSSGSSQSPDISDTEDEDLRRRAYGVDEPRKMSLIELSLGRVSLKSSPDLSQRDSDKPSEGKREGISRQREGLEQGSGEGEEVENVSYCEVMIEPQRRSCVRSNTVSRPESMTYSEIRMDNTPEKILPTKGSTTILTDPQNKDSPIEGSSKFQNNVAKTSPMQGPSKIHIDPPIKDLTIDESSTFPFDPLKKDLSLERSSENRIEPSEKNCLLDQSPPQQRTGVGEVCRDGSEEEEGDGGDVYYLHLMAEGEEVIYDVMYASGQGGIHFLCPQLQDPDPQSDPLHTGVPSMVLELERKLKERRRKIETKEETDELYEDIDQYQNASS